MNDLACHKSCKRLGGSHLVSVVLLGAVVVSACFSVVFGCVLQVVVWILVSGDSVHEWLHLGVVGIFWVDLFFFQVLLVGLVDNEVRQPLICKYFALLLSLVQISYIFLQWQHNSNLFCHIFSDLLIVQNWWLCFIIIFCSNFSYFSSRAA